MLALRSDTGPMSRLSRTAPCREASANLSRPGEHSQPACLHSFAQKGSNGLFRFLGLATTVGAMLGRVEPP